MVAIKRALLELSVTAIEMKLNFSFLSFTSVVKLFKEKKVGNWI